MPLFYHLESEDYERRTGGWIYNDRLISHLRESGCDVSSLSLPAFFSLPDDINRNNLAARLREVPMGAVLIADHLYGMRFSGMIRRHGARLISIFHHSVVQEFADPVIKGEGARLERQALADSSLIVCTSEPTARQICADYGIEAGKVIVAVPGVDRSDAASDYSGGDWSFLTVGAVIPRKRHEFLIEALAGLPDRNWRWTIVGNVSRYPDHVAALEAAISRHGLSDNVRFAGEVDEVGLETLWRSAHLFLAASAHEGYGMAVAEALQRGLPTITTASGAVAEWVGGGAVIVHSDDPREMTQRITEVRADPECYAALRTAALSFARTLPDWAQSMQVAAEAILRL